MGWWGHSPWDGDSPADMLGSLNVPRAACLARLIGVPVDRFGMKRADVAALTKAGDAWVKRHVFYGRKPKRDKNGILVLDDHFDRWAIIGVICQVLNDGVGLDRRIVTWAFDAAEAVWADDAWCNEWNDPQGFRRAARHVADQLAAALDKPQVTVTWRKPRRNGGKTKLLPWVWATIAPAPASKRRKRPRAGRRRRITAKAPRTTSTRAAGS